MKFSYMSKYKASSIKLFIGQFPGIVDDAWYFPKHVLGMLMCYCACYLSSISPLRGLVQL